MKQQLKPYNPPAFIDKFIDKCIITAENFELVMNHYHLSVQPDLTRVQKNELKQIENKIKFLEKLKIRVHLCNYDVNNIGCIMITNNK